MKHRIITEGLIRDHRGGLLVLKMAGNMGVFPEKWGIVGGERRDEELDLTEEKVETVRKKGWL